jgi:hypothetical protein
MDCCIDFGESGNCGELSLRMLCDFDLWLGELPHRYKIRASLATESVKLELLQFDLAQ